MSDPLPDPFEFMKKLWNPMGLPMPGMVAPTLDIEAVEKKIADLKSVENWLNLNLNMLRLSIQGLEMQRNTLAAMKAMQPAPARCRRGRDQESFSRPGCLVGHDAGCGGERGGQAGRDEAGGGGRRPRASPK